MPSVAESRSRTERGLRAGAVLALVAALVRLVLAAQSGGVPRAHLRADGGLAPQLRDSAAAHARAGERVTWSGAVNDLAATSEPVRDPSARTRILVAAATGATIGDSLGAIDSLLAGSGALTTAGLAGGVRVRSASAGPRAAGGAEPSTEARTVSRAGAAPGRVLVLGRIGWESKFTIAALEEAGWLVDARLALADTLRVTQGRTGEPSIATHAAVVVLDSTATSFAGAITRFVRAGGGLVLSGDGAAMFVSLAPGRTERERAGDRDAFDRNDAKAGLPFRPLTALRSDAVLLESRGALASIAARRAAAGRVVQSGLAETWRWRMEGGTHGPEEHRAYWSNLVATAATAPRAPFGPGSRTGDASFSPDAAAKVDLDEVPLATLVERLGRPIADTPPSAPPSQSIPAWLGAAALALLLAEWASRRARGVA